MSLYVAPFARRLSSPPFRVFTRTFSTSTPRTVPRRIETVILDWSGTVVDPGVTSVKRAFVDVFRAVDVPITSEEAAVPMGLLKSKHLQALLETPAIAQRWAAVHKSNPSSQDYEQLIKAYEVAQLKYLQHPSIWRLLPGVLSAIHELRSELDVQKIGVTTGFPGNMVTQLLQTSRLQGFVPDASVAGDDVPRARPFPDMIWRNMQLLGSTHVHTVLKVDDTAGGIGEGLAAGVWTCGLSNNSVYMNFNKPSDVHRLPHDEIARRAHASANKLNEAGAHFVVPDISYVPNVVRRINAFYEAIAT